MLESRGVILDKVLCFWGMGSLMAHQRLICCLPGKSKKGVFALNPPEETGEMHHFNTFSSTLEFASHQ